MKNLELNKIEIYKSSASHEYKRIGLAKRGKLAVIPPINLFYEIYVDYLDMTDINIENNSLGFIVYLVDLIGTNKFLKALLNCKVEGCLVKTDSYIIFLKSLALQYSRGIPYLEGSTKCIIKK